MSKIPRLYKLAAPVNTTSSKVTKPAKTNIAKNTNPAETYVQVDLNTPNKSGAISYNKKLNGYNTLAEMKQAQARINQQVAKANMLTGRNVRPSISMVSARGFSDLTDQQKTEYKKVVAEYNAKIKAWRAQRAAARKNGQAFNIARPNKSLYLKNNFWAKQKQDAVGANNGNTLVDASKDMMRNVKSDIQAKTQQTGTKQSALGLAGAMSRKTGKNITADNLTADQMNRVVTHNDYNQQKLRAGMQQTIKDKNLRLKNLATHTSGRSAGKHILEGKTSGAQERLKNADNYVRYVDDAQKRQLLNMNNPVLAAIGNNAGAPASFYKSTQENNLSKYTPLRFDQKTKSLVRNNFLKSLRQYLQPNDSALSYRAYQHSSNSSANIHLWPTAARLGYFRKASPTEQSKLVASGRVDPNLVMTSYGKFYNPKGASEFSHNYLNQFTDQQKQSMLKELLQKMNLGTITQELQQAYWKIKNHLNTPSFMRRDDY